MLEGCAVLFPWRLAIYEASGEWQLERHLSFLWGKWAGRDPRACSGQIRRDKLSLQEVEEMGETQAQCTRNCILYKILQLHIYIVMDLGLGAETGRQPSERPGATEESLWRRPYVNQTFRWR